MNHAERLYLLGRLCVLDAAAERATKEREVFHPLPIYTPLASGLQARAERQDGRLTLYLRHSIRSQMGAQVDEAFRAFFGEACDRARPDVDGGWVIHTGSAPERDVPNPFAKGAHDVRDPHDGGRTVARGTGGAPQRSGPGPGPGPDPAE